MEDHDAGERISGVLGGGAVVAGAKGVEEGDGRVADAGVCAGVSALAGGVLVIARGWVGLEVVWGEIGEVMEGVKRF